MKKLFFNCSGILLFVSLFCNPLSSHSQLNGIVTVGPGGTYPNLTGPGGLFQAMNSFGLSGNVEVRVTGGLCEPGTHPLNGTSTWPHEVRIIRDPGAIGPLLIVNCTDLIQSMIRLDGLSNMTISGLNFINTNTNPANAKPVLEILNNGAFLTFENNFFASNNPNLVEGSIMLGGSVVNNTIIRNNTISDAVGGGITNYPANAIYANNATSQVLISNNTISNNTNYGIYLNTGNGTQVIGNRIFQSVPKTSSGGGIFITGGGNQTVTNNTIGNGDGLGGGIWTQNSGDFYGIYALINTFAPDPMLNSTISGNIVEDIAFNSTGIPFFSGIFCGQGSANMNNNIIRNCTINANGFIHGFLLSPVTGSTYNLDLNLIDNMINNSTGSTSRTVGLRNQGGNGTMHISNISISNLTSFGTSSSVTSPALAGIEIASTGGIMEILAPILEKLFAGTTSSTPTVAGINVNSSLNNVNIFQAKMRELRNAGLAGSSIYGINTQGGSGNITNNFIGITNNGFNNDVSVIGMNFGGSSSSNYNIYYNSIYLNTVINTGSSSTTCVRRPSSAVVKFLNNAFVNNCQGGTGNHVAIANTRSSSTATGFTGSNYNFLYTRDPAKVGTWNTTVYSFPNWIPLLPLDNNSLTANPANFDPNGLWDPVTGEFTPFPSSPESWYLYGNANPIPGITTDQRGIPGTRPDNIINGVPDIGAFELPLPTIPPPDMTITGVTAPGATQDCFFGGQKLVSITWGMGGILPVLHWVRRYSQPPPGFNGANPNLNSISNFFEVNATGGSGFSANTTFFWFPNADGRISPINTAVMAQQETGFPWTFVPGSTYSSFPAPYDTEAINAQLFRFSLFTAVAPGSTLPVNLLSFKALKKNNDVQLLWSTSGETDHEYFEVERSLEGSRFSQIARVDGNGNSNTTKNYTSTDAGAQLLASSKLYYRLKMVSRSGQSSYSPVIRVPLAGKQNNFSWKAGPNPFTDKFSLSLYLPENSLLELGLYNTAGSLLRKKIVPGEKGYSTVEMNGLENLLPGTYYIQLKKDGRLLSEKLVKVRQ